MAFLGLGLGLGLGLAGVAGSACGGDRAADQRRAAARRESIRRTPLPLQVASTPQNAPLCARLGGALRSHTPPFEATQTTLPAADALARLAAGRLDLVLLSGGPDPALGDALAALRTRTKVTILGADVVAALANITNRSGRVDLAGLRRALRGEVADWRDLKGDDLPLVLYTLPAASDATRHLRAELLQGGPLGVAVRAVKDVGIQIESVRRTPGGLALVPLHHLTRTEVAPKGVKVLPVALRLGEPGALATDRLAAARGAYPLRLPVVALWRRGNDPVARRLREVMTTTTTLQREAWLRLPPQPASDRERARRQWAGERHGSPKPAAPPRGRP